MLGRKAAGAALAVLARTVQPTRSVETFDPGDANEPLRVALRKRGWRRVALMAAMLAAIALVLDLVTGRRLASWDESLLANFGAVLVVVAILFVYVGMRPRPRPPGY